MVRAFKVIYKVTPKYKLRVPLPPLLYAAAYVGLVGSLLYLVAPLAVA
jgi:hypothetical protein